MVKGAMVSVGIGGGDPKNVTNSDSGEMVVGKFFTPLRFQRFDPPKGIVVAWGLRNPEFRRMDLMLEPCRWGSLGCVVPTFTIPLVLLMMLC